MKKLILLNFIVALFFNLKAQNCSNEKSVPEEMYRGRFKEEGMDYGNPYTMFNRKIDGWRLDSTLSKIQNLIINGVNAKGIANTEYSTMYREIYKFDTTNSEPVTCDNKSSTAHPKWTKNQALVYIIGLRYANINGRDTFIRMNDNDRNQFGARAHRGLSNLNPEIISCWGGDDCKYVHLKAFDLIQYLQAYDLLKTRGYILPYDQDRNGLDCSPRNKVREFARNLYIQSEDIINSFTGWKKNHGIICGSALMMSALVLNDAGTEKSLANFFFGWLRGEGTNWPRPNYNPQNWYERGFGTPTGYNIFDGEDGLKDCFFKGDHITFPFIRDVPMTNEDGTAGYAEGPVYFNYVLQAFLPLVRTRDNFGLKKNSLLSPDIKSYANLFKWYSNLLNKDGSLPTYDNSHYWNGNLLGILGEKDFPGYADYIMGSNGNYDLRGDYILALGGGEVAHETLYRNDNSGNVIIENNNKVAKHTFHMLYEQGVAIDKAGSPIDDVHEDDDIGSFQIFTTDSTLNTTIPLSPDCAYLGWSNVNLTNKYWMHNTIEIDDECERSTREYKYPKFDLVNDGKFSQIQEFNLAFDFKSYKCALCAPALVGHAITRNVKAINNAENFYYIINDFVNVESLENSNFNLVKYNLNGNGNKEVNDSFTSPMLKSYRKEDNIHKWTYPCYKNNWGLIAHISILNNNTSGKQSWENTENNNAEGLVNGHITRLQIHQPTKKTIFQSFLYPQKCDWPLPTITKEETEEHVFTKIYFVNAIDTSNKVKFTGKNLPPNPNKTINDTASHLHFARWEGNIADSVTNPFNLPAFTTKKLYLNAQKAFVKNNTYPLFMQGINYCPASSINIRHANFTNGSYLIYGNDTLVKSTQLIDASISFATRQNYLCNIKPLTTPASTDSVIFYLADVARAVDMIALIKGTQDTLPSRYDSINNKIHVKLPNVETTFFVQEKFNCINCFFPPNWRGIDTTLNIENGVTRTLGHKLTIKQPIGLLNITKSSKMEMCPGNYLVNKDSIIIEGPCQTKAYERKSCKGIDSMVAAYSDNSALIVSAGSALVLDSNSRTYIKNGGAIYVKQTGSLIIKSGAFVQIGDSGTCNQGWGEIIAEPGAYVHIEPGAHIEYRRVIGDTNDRNIFLIPSKNSLPIAYEGVYYYTKLILQTDSILPDSTLPFYTYPICGLDTTSPIKNKHWGYTNFAKPLATFTSRNDTLCPNEPLYIKLNRILNDAQYQIKVCRMDSIQVSSPLGGLVWQDTCIMDTIVQDSITPDPVCKEPRNTPEDWTYYFNPGTLHRVTISVWNDCGKLHDTTAFIYTSTPPDVEVNIPTTACEGINTFGASLIDHFPDAKKYTIEVTEKYDSISYLMSKGKMSKSYSKTYFGILPSTIGFDDYFFKGGSKYLISLTITNQCGSVSVYDSISIPLGVNITLTKPTVYGQSVSGATAIKLNGFTTITADSFTWNPTTWLDTATSLTPVSTPLDSITYILKAYKNGCTASDTVHIKYNRFANAGYSDTLCLDSTHSTEKLIGFPYDMSLFLGMLYYYDNTQFMSYYNSHNTGNSPNYFRYFTHFMHTDNFKNSATSCPVDLYNLFTNTLQKHLFFNKSWYRGYYMQFTQFNNSSLPALATFYNQVFNTTALKDHLDSLNNWGNIDPCINDILNQYDDYVQNHVGEITTTWSKIVNNDTTNLSAWNNFFVAENAPLKSTKYILNVITPTAAEIDEITMLVDTILTPLFEPGFQFDSTVYLVNFTEPVSNATSYEWNFGDGSANSFEINPLHTFPAFDSNYVVCLTASNKCSSFMYCDTVWVDSLHLGGSLKTALKPAFFESKTQQPSSMVYRPLTNSQLSTDNIQLSNYPNPFNSSTIIDYQIWQSFNQAELRITNVLGQTVFTQKLNKPIDKINIDGSLLANGIYYYTLIIDGNSIKTKSMSVVH